MHETRHELRRQKLNRRLGIGVDDALGAIRLSSKYGAVSCNLSSIILLRQRLQDGRDDLGDVGRELVLELGGQEDEHPNVVLMHCRHLEILPGSRTREERRVALA